MVDLLKAAGMHFICSYRGESDYEYKGRKYRVRHWAGDDGHYNGDHFERGILPLVGCVIFDSSQYFHDFPPADVVALFPGFVGARFADDFTVEYAGRPDVVTDERGETWAAVSRASILGVTALPAVRS